MKIISKILKYTGIAIAICCMIFVIWAYWFTLSFHGESYPKAEKYIINLSEDTIITKVTGYKIGHPQYRPYEIMSVNNIPYEFGYFTEIGIGTADITTSTQTSNSSWYNFRFYIEQSNAVVGCCIRLNQSPTEILLIDVTTSSYGINKTINYYKEISRKENRKIKRNFEREILDKIFNEKWKHKRWYNW